MAIALTHCRTPIDREDIHELIGRLDDILDLIDEAVNRMVLHKVETPDPDLRDVRLVHVGDHLEGGRVDELDDVSARASRAAARRGARSDRYGCAAP